MKTEKPPYPPAARPAPTPNAPGTNPETLGLRLDRDEQITRDTLPGPVCHP